MGVDLTKPGTFVEAGLSQPAVSRRLGQLTAESIQAPRLRIPGGVIGRTAAQTGIRGAANYLNEPIQSDNVPPELQQVGTKPGGLPTQSAGSGAQIKDKLVGFKLAAIMQNNSKVLKMVEVLEDRLAEESGLELGADEKKGLAKLETADGIVDQIEFALAKTNPDTFGPIARVTGLAENLLAQAGFAPDVRNYNRLRTGVASLLTKSLGEVGNLSDDDIKRAVDLIPKVSDSQQEATDALTQIREIIARARQGIFTISQL